MASASLAAGISQSTDRTCCLSGRRVAIVTLSASLRCFWETIPHPNQPVWVPATGHSSFFLLSRLPVRFFASTRLFFASSPLWTHSRGSGWDRWPHSALWGGKKKKNKLRETWFLNFISSYMHTHKGCQSPDILQVILFGSDHAWPHSTWVSAFCYWLLCCSPTHPHPPPNTHTHTQELLFWVQFCFSRTA